MQALYTIYQIVELLTNVFVMLIIVQFVIGLLLGGTAGVGGGRELHGRIQPQPTPLVRSSAKTSSSSSTRAAASFSATAASSSSS